MPELFSRTMEVDYCGCGGYPSMDVAEAAVMCDDCGTLVHSVDAESAGSLWNRLQERTANLGKCCLTPSNQTWTEDERGMRWSECSKCGMSHLRWGKETGTAGSDEDE